MCFSFPEVQAKTDSPPPSRGVTLNRKVGTQEGDDG